MKTKNNKPYNEHEEHDADPTPLVPKPSSTPGTNPTSVSSLS